VRTLTTRVLGGENPHRCIRGSAARSIRKLPTERMEFFGRANPMQSIRALWKKRRGMTWPKCGDEREGMSALTVPAMLRAIGVLMAYSVLATAGCSNDNQSGQTSSAAPGSTAPATTAPAATRKSFEFNSGRSLRLVIPDGWAARGYQTTHAVRGVILEPQNDPGLEADANRLAAGESATGRHVIIIESGQPCVGDQWTLGPVQSASDAGGALTGRKAMLISEGVTCAHAKAGDRERSTELSAVSTLEKLTNNNAVVAQGN